MAAEALPTHQRVLFALDPARQSLVGLESIIDLAARLHAELVAVLIEDINLLRLAELPFAREIDRASAQARALDRAGLAERWRVHASRLQRTLHASARARNVLLSVKVVRGHFLAEALAAAVAQDVLILSTGDGVSQRHGAAPKPVWVWYDASAAAERALRTASVLSAGRELALLLPAEPGRIVELRREAAQIVGLDQAIGYCEAITGMALSEWLPRLRDRGCSLLVLHRTGLPVDPLSQAALERFECPIVLVG